MGLENPLILSSSRPCSSVITDLRTCGALAHFHARTAFLFVPIVLLLAPAESSWLESCSSELPPARAVDRSSVFVPATRTRQWPHQSLGSVPSSRNGKAARFQLAASNQDALSPRCFLRYAPTIASKHPPLCFFVTLSLHLCLDNKFINYCLSLVTESVNNE